MAGKKKLGQEIFMGITDLQKVVLGEALMNYADKFADKETAVLHLAQRMGMATVVTYIENVRKYRAKMQAELYT